MKVRSVNFKWNPFTMTGEAPASMRWKQSEEEIEFASKEDLEIINANPQLQKVHKAMLAGVQKKLQSFNAEKKQLQEQLTTLDTQLGEWEDWHAQNKDALEKFVKSTSANHGDDDEDESGGTKRKGKQRQEEGSDERFNQLVEAINRGAQAYEQRLGKMDRMLKLSMQLNELYRRKSDLDVNKVLDVALKKGYTDLNKAFEDEEAYGQEILKGKVEEALKPRLEEEIAKRTTNIESGSGAVPLNFELPKELPKSFEDAGTRFLQEREKEASKT